MEPQPDFLRKRKYLKFLVWLIVITCAVIWIVLAWRGFRTSSSLWEAQKYLKKKQYAAAAGVLNHVVARTPTHTGARGLLLFCRVMEQRDQRPVETFTGMDTDGLLRLMGYHALVREKYVPKNNPRVKDIAVKVKIAEKAVRERLKKRGIPTSDWDDAEAVLLAFSNAVWKYIDSDMARKDDPERALLDFASVIIARKSQPGAEKIRALRYLVNRIVRSDAPLSSAGLVHGPDFVELLEIEAGGDNASARDKAVRELFRQRFYGRLFTIASKRKNFKDISQPQAAPVETLKKRYGIFSDESKPFFELADRGFDPMPLFWKINPPPGARLKPNHYVAWVYGVNRKSRTFFNYFFIFSNKNRWEPLRFLQNGELTEVIERHVTPIVDFRVCDKASELALNVPRVTAPPRGKPIVQDWWIPFPLNRNDKSLGESEPPRESACPQ
jgi:hypothetical protein